MKTKLPMKSGFKNADFFKLIEKILDSNHELRGLKDSFKSYKNKYDLCLNHGYYELKTKGQNGYVFFNLSKRFDDREYIFNLIFENTSDVRNLYMEIDCIGGPIELGRIPPFMLDAMRAVSSCDYILFPSLGVVGDIIQASENNIDEIIACIKNYSYDVPMILSTEFNNSHAYDIDENKLSRNLRGFAYIVLVSNDFVSVIKSKTKIDIYNGAVIFYSKGEYKAVRNTDKLFGSDINELAFTFVSNRLQNVIIPKIKAEDDNQSSELAELKKQLNQEREKNAELNQRINELTCENKALNKSLEQANKGSFAIIKSNEIYDGEVLDLIINVLEAEKKNCHESQKRKLQLIDEIIQLNPRTQNGKGFFDTLKNILYNGVDLSGADLSKMTKLGFKIERDNVHYILNFNDVYKFTISKSPSDGRSGKNLYSDIQKALHV